MDAPPSEDLELAGIRTQLDQLWRKVAHSLQLQSVKSPKMGSRRMGHRVLSSDGEGHLNIVNAAAGRSPSYTRGELVEKQTETDSEIAMERGARGGGVLYFEERSNIFSEVGSEEGGSAEKDMAVEELDMVKKLLSRLSEDQVLRWKGKMKDDLLITMQREKDSLEAELRVAWQTVESLEYKVQSLERGSEDGCVGGEKAGDERGDAAMWTGSNLGTPGTGSPDSTTVMMEGRGAGRFREGRELKQRLSGLSGLESKKGMEGSGGGFGNFFPRPPLRARSSDREHIDLKKARAAMEAYAERVTKDLAAAQQSLVKLGHQAQQLAQEVEMQTGRLRDCEGQLAQVRKERDSLVPDLKAALGGWSAAADELAAFSQQNVELGKEIEALRGESHSLHQSLKIAQEEKEDLRQERDRWQAHKDIIGELARMDTSERRGRAEEYIHSRRDLFEEPPCGSDSEDGEWRRGNGGAGRMRHKSSDLPLSGGSDWDADVRSHLPPILVLGSNRNPSFPPRSGTTSFTGGSEPGAQKRESHKFNPRAPPPAKGSERGTYVRQMSSLISRSSVDRGDGEKRRHSTHPHPKGNSNIVGKKPFGSQLYPTESFSDWQRSDTAPVPDRKRTPHSPPLARKPVPIILSQNY